MAHTLTRIVLTGFLALATVSCKAPRKPYELRSLEYFAETLTPTEEKSSYLSDNFEQFYNDNLGRRNDWALYSLTQAVKYAPTTARKDALVHHGLAVAIQCAETEDYKQVLAAAEFFETCGVELTLPGLKVSLLRKAAEAYDLVSRMMGTTSKRDAVIFSHKASEITQTADRIAASFYNK